MNTNKYKILVVEDEANIRNFVAALLESAGYQVVAAEKYSMASLMFSSHIPDLIILDLGLPDMDGTVFIEKVRSESAVPIIVLSARSEEKEKVKALDMGANDYITKPFEIEELLARIRVALRKSSAQTGSDSLLTSGLLTLDAARHSVCYDKTPISLTHREFELLRELMTNRGIVLSRDHLLEHVWGYDYAGETNVVDVYIRYLRQKIDDAFSIKRIHTVRGVGYVFRDAEGL